MASKNNGRDGVLVKKWTWKYQGVESELSDFLRGEDQEPHGSEGLMKKSQDQRSMLVKEKVVNIELRLLEQLNDEDLPRTVKAVEFKLVCRDLGIELIGSDVEALRKAMWAKLEKAHEIKWEPWYLVQIASARSFVGDMEVGFSLSQNTIYKGVAGDGSVLMREYERGRTFSPWRYKPWPGAYQDKGGHVIACIPSTPANDAALDEFRERIRALQKMISDMVKPETIMETLANLAGVGLPAPLSSTDRRLPGEDA